MTPTDGLMDLTALLIAGILGALVVEPAKAVAVRVRAKNSNTRR